MDWMLTDEEMGEIQRLLFGTRKLQPIDELYVRKAVAQAQVKKVAEHYEGQCTEHWRHTSWYVPRRRCDSCMMELYRQVGLE